MPDQKFTSSRDILLVVYFMVKNAQFKEKMQATESEAAEQQSSTPKEKGTQAGNWKQMLEQEADRQMQGFGEKAEGLVQEEQQDRDKEFILYLSGLKVLDNLKLVAPKTENAKAQTLEILEQHVSEFTVKKKTDIIIETRSQIRRSISKKKNKRDDKLSVHDLVLESNHKMKKFAVDATAKAENPAPSTSSSEEKSVVG